MVLGSYVLSGVSFPRWVSILLVRQYFTYHVASLFPRMIRVKWWNWRYTAAVLRPQRNQMPSSTGSASHLSVKCAFMKDCKSQKSLTVIHSQYLMKKIHPCMLMLYCLCRFLHKNPEDTSEVPNGFLSDINPVSTSALQ